MCMWREDQYTFLIISRLVLLRMRDVADESCREYQNTVSCTITFFFENLAFYEVMWKNTVELSRPHMTIWHMRIACWVHKATNTHSEYVILIAFLRQQWLHEGASVLHYVYIACLVTFWNCLWYCSEYFLIPSILLHMIYGHSFFWAQKFKQLKMDRIGIRSQLLTGFIWLSGRIFNRSHPVVYLIFNTMLYSVFT